MFLNLDSVREQNNYKRYVGVFIRFFSFAVYNYALIAQKPNLSIT